MAVTLRSIIRAILSMSASVRSACSTRARSALLFKSAAMTETERPVSSVMRVASASSRSRLRATKIRSWPRRADRKLATGDRSGLGLEEGAAGLKRTQDALTENPLLRSGLILAGINQSQSGPGEDGVLTALEAAQLNLWGTKLVVLSACDTGRGEVKNGDGVYGLRRALALAGSESQVMSLWQVADKATRELMVGYYTGLQRGQGRSEALRNVQLQMLRSGERRHPYYWAGFIQSGEWANLEGKR